MEERYNPQAIEPKWQNTWLETGADRTSDESDRPKFFALSMFPYPSGNLHMGHVRNYSITDVIARFKRMNGFRVLHPMGWDAFGLPAENAAIDRGISPAVWTKQNIAQMRTQLQQLGLSYDWDREVTTCSPDYYRWTQWLFLQFLDSGLAYQKESAVNWDPIDQTVLANEQVDAEGKSWRSGAVVEKRMLRQWFLKITDYAEQLLQDLDKLPGWPDKVRAMQANWIGKSTGARVVFQTEAGAEIPVFTTRPDTLWGATFMVLSPEHPLVPDLVKDTTKEKVEAYKTAAAAKSEIDRTDDSRDKTGVFSGSYAINPVNDRKIPIWVADYVLMGYGTGAIMAVPAHDQRDFDFATAFGLDIIPVVFPPDADPETAETLTEAYADNAAGVLRNSGPLDGLTVPDAKQRVIEHLEEKQIGTAQVNYRLRDWLISRQRYWGCPIPVILCPDCGIVPVPDDQLPVELPADVEFTGRGASPLAQLDSWVHVDCPSCGTAARRETDTMDTFIDSSWYFLRYSDATNDGKVFEPNKVNDWLPVDQYVGGIEHAILHLLYSRFFTKVVRDRGLLNFDEPFKRLLTQGMVQSLTYKDPKTNEYIPADKIEVLEKPVSPSTGNKLEVFFEKMSKSKYNGVDPQSVLQHYGADTARMFILFKAPPEKDLEWDDADVEGQFRFLNRVWRLVEGFVSQGARPEVYESGDLSKAEKDLRRATHIAIKEVTEDIEEGYQFNTAIAELMKLNNALNDAKLLDSPVYAEGLQTLVQLLAPFAPHIAEELWAELGHTESVHTSTWPTANANALVADSVTIVIQVNGKRRGEFEAPSDVSREQQEELAKATDAAQKYLAEGTLRKAIVVPKKLVNFVIK
ncbi:MAG: leucine--tRNA ligase [Cyanobacteria bacterium P01_E01_bin.45]